MNRREQLAKDNGMTIEFVNWFFDNKKDGCGNAWLVMMAAMWESWKHLSEQRDALAAEVYDVKHPGTYLPSKCETPATDAFLREVKAQGVEEFVKRLRDSADIYDKNGRHEWADHNRVVADDGNVFAAELRQGGAA